MDNIIEKETVTIDITTNTSVKMVITPKNQKFLKLDKTKFKMVQNNDKEWVFLLNDLEDKNA